jgi:DNA topoisomerase VI subunit B
MLMAHVFIKLLLLLKEHVLDQERDVQSIGFTRAIINANIYA